MDTQASPRFALIAEGPSDQVVLTHFLAAYFRDMDIVANPVQPPSAHVPGGWTGVVRCCASPRVEAALVDNDYVVIQIDTDVCEEVGFDVPRRDPSGRELAPDELAEKVVGFLIAGLAPTVYERFAGRIIFAVCVDSIECWLLPLYYQDGRRAKTANCLGSLNRQISEQEGFSIDPGDKQTSYYEKIVRSKKCGKRKVLEGIADSNPSLTCFVRSLDRCFPHARMLSEPEPAPDAEA